MAINIPNGHKTYQHFPFHGPLKFTQIAIFWYENIQSGNPGVCVWRLIGRQEKKIWQTLLLVGQIGFSKLSYIPRRTYLKKKKKDFLFQNTESSKFIGQGSGTCPL
jgi:hypothetical protein